MPESACLHIQARESDPVRVVDLTGNSARVGRAAYCDVRLADPDLADEVCRLRRRGGAWQIVPVAPGASVQIDGLPVAGPAALPIGSTFVIGGQRLTLRLASTSPLWVDRPAPVPEIVAAEAGDAPAGVALVATRREGWEGQGDAGDRWVRAQRETRRWETRWRAAGEKLRAAPTTGAAVPPARPGVPTVAARPVRPEGLNRDPVARRPAPRPAQPQGPAVSPALSPAPPAARLAGYVPPVAPNARREPLRPTAWSHSPAPRRPITPGPVPLTRPQPSVIAAGSRDTAAPELVEERVEAVRAECPDPETLLNDLGISRIEHGDLDTLISRLQTPEPGDDPAAGGGPAEAVVGHADTGDELTAAPEPDRPTVPDLDVIEIESPAEAGGFATAEMAAPVISEEAATIPTQPAPPVEDEVCPPCFAAEPEPRDQDDEDEDRDEPETGRPVLGATRRGARVCRQEPESGAAVWEVTTPEPEPATVERTGPDAFRTGATRWVAHRPRPGDDAWPATEAADEDGGWSYQVPFVTDTNLVESVDQAPPAREWSAPLTETTESSGRWSEKAARDWPTVGEILAAQGVRSGGPATAAAVSVAPRRPEPTAARGPRQWRLPIWLGWVPGSTLVLGVGLVGLSGAWGWSRDGYNAGLIAERLAAADPAKAPLPPGVVPPGGSWWTTSANHLVQWAAYLDRTGADPARAEEARRLLDRAAGLAPLNPSVRYALARPVPGEPPVAPATALARSLGQSRDVPALAWSGRVLLAAGKREAALRAFREALEMAARADLTRSGVPAFLDDAAVRRYALPTEDQVGAVVREMAGAGAWTFADWAGVLPRGTAAAVTAARVLRESGSPDAGLALKAALAEGEAEAARPSPAATAPAAERAAAAVRLAAWAEALAMTQRWADARDRYRQAVELMPVDALRRAWCLNLADLAARLGEDSDRQQALEAAKVADLKDEVTRRAVDLQRAPGGMARRPAGGAETEARR